MTAGTGHRRAAEAIAEVVRRLLPQAEVICVDLLAYTPRWFRWIYPRLYETLVRFFPPLWGWSYTVIDQPRVFGGIQPIRRAWNRLMARRCLRSLREHPPDVLIATHFFPADCFASAKRLGWLSARLIVVMTDLFPHRVWFTDEAEAVVVGSKPTYALCRQRGIAVERLHLLGIPVGPSFTQPIDRPRVLEGLGLDSNRRTVLIASGGMGVGPIAQLVRQLMKLESDRPGALQLIVVCGANEPLRQEVERITRPSRMPVRVFGFVETMPQLMQASDLMVTKAGGLSLMEALTVGIPLVIFAVIPGQEELNAEYVTSHGAAMMASRIHDVVGTIRDCLDHPAKLSAMRERACLLAHPDAASEIVKQLVLPIAHGT
ncbi:MAG: glycosyltransferase [Candidatus Omnitrophica bacterium]|nr:glycosyltransferase [Candidatus Omnitrophota bacterium]